MLSDKAIRNALKELPLGLDATYVRILTSIRQRFPAESATARIIFYWLVHSVRPLSLKELAEAITIESGQTQIDFLALPTNEEDVMQYIAGIAMVTDGPDRRVGLAHYSVQEFLLSK